VLTLGIETSTRQVGCAIGDERVVLGAVTVARDQRHTETLVPAIQFLLGSAGFTMAHVDAVAVGLGPGLFTGLRVGVATARALAQARDLPLLGVSSLDLVAHRARMAGRPIVVAMDARRGELFWARYEPVPGGARRLGDDHVDPPAVVAAAVAELRTAVLVGDGVARYPGTFAGMAGVELVGGEAALPSPAVLVELAAPRLAAGERTSPADVLPCYVRAPDAAAHWVERRRVVGGDEATAGRQPLAAQGERVPPRGAHVPPEGARVPPEGARVPPEGGRAPQGEPVP
jgi:tRNA threonylcarbamoyladenosine biosynthesis protein TsaB